MIATIMNFLPVSTDTHIYSKHSEFSIILPTTSFPITIELNLGAPGWGTGELFGTSSLRKLPLLGDAFLIPGAQLSVAVTVTI